MAGLRPGAPPAGEHAATAGYSADQVANAAVIVAVGAQLGVPVRGWIIAVAVAMQESGLRNLDHGDSAGPDSRGLFQQRSAWGSLAVRLDRRRVGAPALPRSPRRTPGCSRCPAGRPCR